MIRRQHIFPVPVLPGLVLLILCTSVSGRGQTGPSAAATSAQNPFLGSVPTGQATATPLPLSLKDAFDRALKYNLGLIESDQATRAARAARLHSLNALLPDLTARVSSTIQQIDLKALGFGFHFPGVNIPTMSGPSAWRTLAPSYPRRSSTGRTSRT